MVEIYKENVKKLENQLKLGESFDIVKREITSKGGTCSTLFYIDNFLDNDIFERILSYIIKYEERTPLIDSLPFGEMSFTADIDTAVTKVLSGAVAVLCEECNKIALIYVRKYPNRSIEEPENEKVLKGPRDGFGENLATNTILLRRRIKSPNLVFKTVSLGRLTKTDVAVCYLSDKVDKKFLGIIMKKLENTDISTLSFGEQSIAEQLVKTRWYNPFPKFRFTERPDSAAAMVLEGSVIIICDNTPEVLILPTSIFDFLQEADDFYLPSLTATYFRAVRLFICILSIYILPTWYLLIKNPDLLPSWLSFIEVKEFTVIPVLVQIFIVELIIDGLKIASLNTPKALGNSFSVIAGLILGDMAVNIGWFIPEVILYLALITIANFSQPSYELGYALKFMRIFLTVMTAAFNIPGFIIGAIAVPVFILTNKTVEGGRGYLYPLIPFNRKALKRFFVRVRL